MVFGKKNNDVTWLAAKLKFQLTMQQISSFQRARSDKITSEIFFGKAQLVKKLLSFDFWISPILLLFLETQAHF